MLNTLWCLSHTNYSNQSMQDPILKYSLSTHQGPHLKALGFCGPSTNSLPIQARALYFLTYKWEAQVFLHLCECTLRGNPCLFLGTYTEWFSISITNQISYFSSLVSFMTQLRDRLSQWLILTQCGRGLHKGMNTRRQGPLEVILDSLISLFWFFVFK